jgi:predicted RNA-binding protein YlqC (UPF0109 family)
MGKDLVAYIAKALVDDPGSVEVTENPGAEGVVLELRTAPDDTGKVIGKNGRMAKAMRTLLAASAYPEGPREGRGGYSLEIVD